MYDGFILVLRCGGLRGSVGWAQLKWSYFVDLLHFIHNRSAQLLRRQRRLEAKMISLRAMTCAVSCLLVRVGTCANF
jgi:hypothetical protein